LGVTPKRGKNASFIKNKRSNDQRFVLAFYR